MISRVTEKQLRTLIIHARETTSYYASILPAPEECLKKDINELMHNIPLLTREELQNNRFLFYSIKGDKTGWRRIKTSGTSGEPLEIVLDPGTCMVESMIFTKQVDSVLKTLQWRKNRVYHLTLHHNASSNCIPSSWDSDGTTIKWNLFYPWLLPDQEFSRYLSCINGSVICLMPSVAYILCRRIQSSRNCMKIVPRLVVLSGEMIERETRSLVQETFSCPVTSLYTMSEAGIIATEAPDNASYHVEDLSVYLEIITAKGTPAEFGESGEIVITPINNFAMPLIRYRTGDAGCWNDRDKTQLNLLIARKLPQFTAGKNTAINIIRFSKIFSSLGVNQFRLIQKTGKKFIFYYYKKNLPLLPASAQLIRTAMYNTFGPFSEINIVRVPESRNLSSLHHRSIRAGNTSRYESPGIDIKSISRWIKIKLQKEKSINLSVITGSVLEPLAATKYSDIDLIIFITGDKTDRYWFELAGRLKEKIPSLSVSFDNLDGFTERAPLIACRLLCENRVLTGKRIENGIRWPAYAELASFAAYWKQDTYALLYGRLQAMTNAEFDPVKEAWIGTKFISNALRLRYLLKGYQQTKQKDVLALLITDPDIPGKYKSDFLKAFDYAREFIPPDKNRKEMIKNIFFTIFSFLESYLMPERK